MLLDILAKIWKEVGIVDEEHLQDLYERNQYKKYLTVFHLADPVEFTEPIPVFKRSRHTWVADYDPPTELLYAVDPDLAIRREAEMVVHLNQKSDNS